jgi:hypothetical protein
VTTSLIRNRLAAKTTEQLERLRLQLERLPEECIDRREGSVLHEVEKFLAERRTA